VWWVFWPLLYLRFTVECVLREFLKLLNIWQSYGAKVYSSSVLYTAALSCWKMKNVLEIWCTAGRNCFNSITLRIILLINLDSMINKYQIDVMSASNDLLPDAMLTSLGEYFSAFVLNDWALCGSSLLHLWATAIFWSQTFHKVVLWCVWDVVGYLITTLPEIYCNVCQ